MKTRTCLLGNMVNGNWGLGNGNCSWELGIGDWGLRAALAITYPQSPIPKFGTYVKRWASLAGVVLVVSVYGSAGVGLLELVHELS